MRDAVKKQLTKKGTNKMNDKRKWSELNLEERNAELRRLCDVYKGIKQIADQLNTPKTWSELNPEDARYLESSSRRDCFPRIDY
ncbi:MAG: hypothetical protein EBT78_08235 [Betaproteobacteria bacterium]|nr:hypothetical protein [Betaproteobacteria bacterium]